MAARKAVFTLTVAGTGFTAAIIGAPPFAGVSAEEIKLGAFGDKSFTKLISEIAEYGDVQVTILDEGTDNFSSVGTQESITFTAGYGSEGTATVTRTFTVDCTVKAIEPTTIEVDGNRRSAITITLTPVGGDTPSFGGSGGGQ